LRYLISLAFGELPTKYLAFRGKWHLVPFSLLGRRIVILLVLVWRIQLSSRFGTHSVNINIRFFLASNLGQTEHSQHFEKEELWFIILWLRPLHQQIRRSGVTSDVAWQTKGATPSKYHHKFDPKMDPINFPSGPMTRSCANKYKALMKIIKQIIDEMLEVNQLIQPWCLFEGAKFIGKL
jgi:hypothetical protein